MSDWKYQNSYIRPNKRQFDEINNQIECLKQELYVIDQILWNELESSFLNVFDRAYLAAEMYKNRLIALTESSRAQMLIVQMAVSTNNYNNNYDAKRTKYSHGIYYGNNQYNSHNNWGSYNNNSYYNRNQGTVSCNNRKRKQKVNKNKNVAINTKAIQFVSSSTDVKPIPLKIPKTAPVKPAEQRKRPLSPITAVPVKKSTGLLKTPPGPKTVGPVKNIHCKKAVQVNATVQPKMNTTVETPTATLNTALTKTNISVVNHTEQVIAAEQVKTAEQDASAVKTFTATTQIKVNTAGDKITPGEADTSNAVIVMPVKTEPNSTLPKTSSLFSKDYNLQFSVADKVTIKTENPAEPAPAAAPETVNTAGVVVKVELNNDEVMQDDLEDHL